MPTLPATVRPEDRLEYTRCLQRAQAGDGAGNFSALLYRRLDAILDEYLSALEASAG